jgi:hypothetical protein
VKEISELKGELEKYKMSEKLATSILESPYNYSNNAQAAIRRRKRNGSNLNGTTSALGDNNNYGEKILDSSFTSQNSNISFSGVVSGGIAIPVTDKPSFFISDGNLSAKGFDSNPSTPHNLDFT